MSDDLLKQARTRADRCPTPVRAAARMRIARVQSAKDAGQARITFEMALEEISTLSGRERHTLFEQAQQIAAAIAPDLLREIPSVRSFPDEHRAETLLRTMLDHGQVDGAFDYVIQRDARSAFPFAYCGNLLEKLDAERRVAVLRRAVQAWRTLQDVERRQRGLPGVEGRGGEARFLHQHWNFIRLFQYRWQLLPSEEALSAVREIVDGELERPDGTTSASHKGVRITSRREFFLFEVFHVLRCLDPSLAESLIARHAELAAAVQRYPNGFESMREEFEQQAEIRRQQLGSSAEDRSDCYVIAGNVTDVPRQLAMLQASRQGDFGPSLDYALELYREDTDSENPNFSPKAVWPSTCSFRTNLYNAAKQLGSEAATLLQRIPDPELRLFAQIELAAGLAGLPAAREISRKERRPSLAQRMRQGMPLHGAPMRSPDGGAIRCPKCHWVPTNEARWSCKCGHEWNTFHTRGLCPACKHQWETTQCLECNEVSRHTAWYLTE